MAMYCEQARIISIDVATCGGYDRAEAAELCGKNLMIREEKMENRKCDRSVPAANPGPVVSAQIRLQKPHKRRPSLVVLVRGALQCPTDSQECLAGLFMNASAADDEPDSSEPGETREG